MTIFTSTHAPCPVCQSKVHGRSDKRYCSTKCKNRHHYTSRKINKPMTTVVNAQQLRNLTILEGLMQNGPNTLEIHQTVLVKLGFCIETVTGYKLINNGIVLKCYHFSYTIGVNGMFIITKHDEVGVVWPGFYERWIIDFPDLETKKTNCDDPKLPIDALTSG